MTNPANVAALDAILVLQCSDIAHLTANRELYGDLPLLFIDPGTLDAALQAGLSHCAFRRLDVPADMPANAYSEAVNRGALLDRLLMRERHALFGSAASDETLFTGWEQMLLYLSLQRAFTARALGRCVNQQFPERRIGLLRPDNAQLMNFDSMLSAEMVAAVSDRFVFVANYTGARFYNPDMTQLVWHGPLVARQVQEQGVDAVVHIATCFYDVETFSRAIRDRFPRILDLPGTYCDVPVARTGPLLARMADLPAQALDPAALRYRERAYGLFKQHLSDWIPSHAALLQQAGLWADRSQQKALNFLSLRQALQGRQPHFVIADHDTGMTGPLFSVAAELGCAITALPHSGCTTSILPHARRVTAIERRGFGAGARSVLNQPVPVRKVNFRRMLAPQVRPSPGRPKRVCLLLNTMMSEGITHVDFYPMWAFYRELDALCTAAGAELRVRLKPSVPALRVVAGAFGKPPEWFHETFARPIEDIALESDLTIAYGEMTSGAAPFLDAASLVLHVSEQLWPCDPLITPTYIRDGLVQSLNGERGLAEVRRLLTGDEVYGRAQAAQARAYLERCAGAVDTFFE